MRDRVRRHDAPSTDCVERRPLCATAIRTRRSRTRTGVSRLTPSRPRRYDSGSQQRDAVPTPLTTPVADHPTTRPPFNPLTALGPGLITGAADDDPSGIATYSQAGAQFGLHMLWTMVL